MRFGRHDSRSSAASVRRRATCDAALAALQLPLPFSVREFCKAVELRTGRRIDLHAMPVGWAPPGLCGLLVQVAEADHIFFTRQPSDLAQATTIVHECGHILIPDGQPRESAELPPALAKLFTQPIVAVHGRTAFSDDAEATVELFASMVLSAAAAGELEAPTSPSAARLAERFG